MSSGPPGEDDAAVGDAPARPLRRDAERNRRRIVTAARELIATHGLGVSYEEIARSADVAVGTVYNRFPRREDLVDLIFSEQVEEVVDLAHRAQAIPDPWEALVAFMTGTLELQASNRGLRELGSGTSRHSALGAHARERIAPVATELLQRAQDAGVLRRDVSQPDLALVPIMVGAVIDSTREDGVERRPDEGLWRRALALVMDGLRPVTGAPLPGHAPGTELSDEIFRGPAPRGGDARSESI